MTQRKQLGKSRRGRRTFVPKLVEAVRHRVKDPTQNVKFTEAGKELVQEQINKNLTTKRVDLAIVGGRLTQFNSRISGFIDPATPGGADMWALLPAIAQPDTSGNPNFAITRSSNSIRPKSLIVKGYLWMDSHAVSTSSDYTGLNVRLYIMSSKRRTSYEALSDVNTATTPLDGFQQLANQLLTSNGSVVPYNGGIVAHNVYKTSRKIVTIHHKKDYHLKRKQVEYNSATGEVGAQDSVKVPFRFSIPVPKKCNYKDSKSIAPTDWAPILALGYCKDNGQPGNSGVNLPQEPFVFWSSHLSYTDA